MLRTSRADEWSSGPRFSRHLLVWLPSLLLLALPAPLGDGHLSDRIERQREAFVELETFLAQGVVPDAEMAARIAALQDYPLAPYLRYAELTANIATADPSSVAAFLAEQAGTALGERLRDQWLEQLARRGRWSEYLAYDRPDPAPTRQCRRLFALFATGRRDEALAQIPPLWLVGRSQPAACDPVFDAWRAAGLLTPDLVRQRIDLAMDADDRRLARYLGRYLPDEEQPRLADWLAVRADPRRVADLKVGEPDDAWQEAIIVDGIARVAPLDIERAIAIWAAKAASQILSDEAHAAIESALAMALVRDRDDRALAFFDRIPATEANLPLQERRLRDALERQDWMRVADWVAAMPDSDIKTERWLYWHARAEEALGRHETAHDLYRQAASVRGFWGFLAADRVGAAYHLGHRQTPFDERVGRLIEDPARVRIEELLALGREADAHREWTYLTRELAGDELAAAAVIAHGLDWPDRAIRTLARAGRWDDLALRFPIHHRELVQSQAAVTELPESWIYAVIRQESAFATTAGSSAGAVGLMQLMPATAHEVAARLDHPPPSRAELVDPATNIRLGSHYLAQMARWFDGHPVLATAAYNAGPGRVRQWRAGGPAEADLWIATIPFYETRSYVQRVLAYRIIYADRLGLDDGPLSAWLTPIVARAGHHAQLTAETASDGG